MIETDESWLANDLACSPVPVGTQIGFDVKEKRPDSFPFCYKPINYISKETVEGGLLFGFEKETFFARTRFTTNQDSLFVSFGESREEALDLQWSVIHKELPITEGIGEITPQAFRYLYVTGKDVEISAEYEYLPLEYRGNFQCSDETINRVWDVAAYTFHLNSREFFLDGIKCDRWVWSGDAYQSLFVNRYLFFDAGIEQRTLVALGGKKPFEAHINTIIDYSYLWIMALYECYMTFGDKNFLHQIFPQMKEIVSFCRAKVDEDGFVRQKPGDWVFIDWSITDKERGNAERHQTFFTEYVDENFSSFNLCKRSRSLGHSYASGILQHLNLA